MAAITHQLGYIYTPQALSLPTGTVTQATDSGTAIVAPGITTGKCVLKAFATPLFDPELSGEFKVSHPMVKSTSSVQLSLEYPDGKTGEPMVRLGSIADGYFMVTILNTDKTEALNSANDTTILHYAIFNGPRTSELGLITSGSEVSLGARAVSQAGAKTTAVPAVGQYMDTAAAVITLVAVDEDKSEHAKFDFQNKQVKSTSVILTTMEYTAAAQDATKGQPFARIGAVADNAVTVEVANASETKCVGNPGKVHVIVLGNNSTTTNTLGITQRPRQLDIPISTVTQTAATATDPVRVNTTVGIVTLAEMKEGKEAHTDFRVYNAACKTTSAIALTLQLATAAAGQAFARVQSVSDGYFTVSICNGSSAAALNSAAAAGKLHYWIVN